MSMEKAYQAMSFKRPPKFIPMPEMDSVSPLNYLSILYTNKAIASNYLNKKEKALEEIDDAIDLFPENAKAYELRGTIELMEHNYLHAANDLYIAAKLKPSRSIIAKAEKARKEYLAHAQPINRQPTPVPPQKQEVPKSDDEDHEEFEYIKEYNFNSFTVDDAKAITEEIRNGKILTERNFAQMLLKVKEILEKLPNIVYTNPKSTIKVVGDTHGQLQDLLYIFDHFGFPSNDNPYLFNGDYVDRGSQGLEILMVLFAWKIAAPDALSLNRGNHESDSMNYMYGFKTECSVKMSDEIFQQCSDTFGYLPIGHVIGKKVLVVHGGLFGSDDVTLDMIQKADRTGQPPESGPLNDILWADPMDQPGRAPSPRGVTQMFGADVTESFLKREGLELLIRSHQLVNEGYLVQHDGKCITVFSAPNYIGRSNNLAAICFVSFDQNGELLPLKFETFTAQEIPTKFTPMKYTPYAAYFQ